MSNFPEPSNNKKKTVELDFSNYATKSDLKNVLQALIYHNLLKKMI